MAQEFITKIYSKEEFFRGFAFGDEKARVKFKSINAKDFDWFRDTTLIGMSFGTFSRRKAFKIKLCNCLNKFQTVLWEKLNEKLGGESPITANSDIKEELDKGLHQR